MLLLVVLIITYHGDDEYPVRVSALQNRQELVPVLGLTVSNDEHGMHWPIALGLVTELFIVLIEGHFPGRHDLSPTAPGNLVEAPGDVGAIHIPDLNCL